MRKLILISIVCAFVAVPAFADSMQAYINSSYQMGSGGEFTVQMTPLWSPDPRVYYSSTAPDTRDVGTQDPSFQTFCVETTEYFSPGSQYDVGLSDAAIYNNLGSANSDPLSVGAAWLYRQFAQGTLNGYNYSTAVIPDSVPMTYRQVSADSLQKAIWYLEGEGGGVNNSFVTAAADQFGSLSAAQGDNYSAGVRQIPVMVMNLFASGHFGDYNYRAQDMLVVVPVPAAVLLGLLGLGAAGMKLRKFV
jgi:hypothetical protein